MDAAKNGCHGSGLDGINVDEIDAAKWADVQARFPAEVARGAAAARTTVTWTTRRAAPRSQHASASRKQLATPTPRLLRSSRD